MGFNDHIDIELYEAIGELTASGELEEGSPAYGVAQQVIHTGYESLTPKQRTLYDKVVMPALERRGAELEILHKQIAAAP